MLDLQPINLEKDKEIRKKGIYQHYLLGKFQLCLFIFFFYTNLVNFDAKEHSRVKTYASRIE